MKKIAIMILLLVAAAGCASEDPAVKNPKSPAQKDNEILIETFAFKPAKIEIKVGETVFWAQKDNTTHTVTSGTVGPIDPLLNVAQGTPDGKFDSGNIPQNGDYDFTFQEAGTYPYFCEIHPEGMRGEVVVAP